MRWRRGSGEFTLVAALAVICIVVIVAFCGCETIQPGNVGIKVNKMGDNRGVEDIPTVTGFVFYFRPTTVVYEFPIFKQNAVWTRDLREGAATDESMTFNSVEGAQINADVACSYSIDGTKVPHLFVEFRTDLNTITHGYLRSEIRDSLNRHASTMKVTDIYGPLKQQLLDNVKKDLMEKLQPRGFLIDYISFANGLRVDASVQTSINAVIQQTQDAIKAEGKIRQTKAEADQKVAEVDGAGRSRQIQANAEALAITTKAKASAEAMLMERTAEAKGNEMIAKTLTPEVLRARAIEKWSGNVPQFSGGQQPIPFLDVAATRPAN